VEKKLFKIGNSVALVIDKPLRATLGIKATTLVRVTTDGQRLIVEPCGERSEEVQRSLNVSEKIRAQAVAWDLLTRYDMSNHRFERLSSGWDARGRLRSHRYKMWVEDVDWATLTDAERRVVRRFEVAHRVLRSGATWEAAIAEALGAEPFDREDPAERAAGSSFTRR
jgi:antitoxin component of MazEF toxin-antitoxin module